ncbi:choice-of-anchor I family protein [Oceanobacillus sp. CF4.6]|uniref:choice-of-anchor I family protein n=1 Tax=Oceanobacillus sp. CF4.6 TaxID=3373080 RepID=UPI003EE69FDD
MTMRKKFVAGAAATMLFTSAVPFNVFADQTPLFQYGGEDLTVSQVGQYDSGLGEGGTEIMTYDPELDRAFVTNGVAAGFDILSFKKLKSGKFSEVKTEKRILLADYGIQHVEDITSIASHPTKDLIAISAVSNPKTDPGYIVFTTKSGDYMNHVQVGSLPDMVTFTPDGTKAVVANEGEPNDDYSVDPEGSISIIDVTGNPEDFRANTLSFHGVELDEKVRVQSEGTTLQQLEPEFVAVSEDSTQAFVSMQENNAIATVDLETEEILNVKGLGMKDHSVTGNELDAKDNNETTIEKQPLLGFYMPDAIDIFKADHYEGYTQEELDQAVEGGLLDELGKTNITLEAGKNEEGIYESLHTYGARSFSIFDAETMELIYDSGSEFERITAEALPEHFNTNNDELKYDGRSDAKGPEPETIVSGEIDGTTYAFIALERFSGIMVYDLSNPLKPEFTKLISSRDFSEDVKGDVSPEGLQFIPAEQSPTGNDLLAATHEVSGTVAVYEFNGKIKGSKEWNQSDNKYKKQR